MSSTTLSPLKFVILLLLASMAAFWIGYTVIVTTPDDTTSPIIKTQIAEILPEPRPLPDFKLQNGEQQSFSKQDLKDHWSLLFFGYTNCPDICPNTMMVMKQFLQQLQQQQVKTDALHIIFVSVDPERDTPELLQEYVAYFNDDFIGLTGSISEIEKLSRKLGILYGYEDPDPKTGNYIVNHSAQIIVINPAAQFHAVLPPPHEAGIIAQDFTTMLNRYEN